MHKQSEQAELGLLAAIFPEKKDRPKRARSGFFWAVATLASPECKIDKKPLERLSGGFFNLGLF
jgi:hypothetical protein